MKKARLSAIPSWIRRGHAGPGCPSAPFATTTCASSFTVLPTKLANFVPAAGGRVLVAHDAAREAGQDRRQDRAPWSLRRVRLHQRGLPSRPARRLPRALRPAALAPILELLGLRTGSLERPCGGHRPAAIPWKTPLAQDAFASSARAASSCGSRPAAKGSRKGTTTSGLTPRPSSRSS
jgi:hypothetical protein